MMAALPDKAPAKPAKPRKVLVLDSSLGFRHPSIPIAFATIEALGQKAGAWTATMAKDASEINTANLAQYDAVFLDSTTGCFLDKAGDPAETAANALLTHPSIGCLHCSGHAGLLAPPSR